MADEAAPTNDGSLESAVSELQKARHAAAEPQDDGNRQDDTSGAQIAATEDDSQESPPDQQEADEADTTEADTSDAEQVSNIDAPAWFNAEEREAFKTLPPEAQASLQRLAKSAQSHISQKQNEHQTAMQAAQEAAATAAQERQYLQSAIQHYKHPIESAFRQEFPDVISGQVDLFRLAQDTERWGRYQAFQSEFQRIGQAEMQLSQRSEHEEQARLSQHIEARNTKLIEAKPELKDPVKFQQFDNDVTAYLRAVNVPDERIARVSLEELQIVEKAMLWDKAQKAKVNAPKTPQLQLKPGQTAVQGHVRTLPKVMKPGVPNSAGAAEDKIVATKQQLRKTGSVDDAAKAIRLLLDRRRVSA